MLRSVWNGSRAALVTAALFAAASVASAGIYTFQDGDANAYDGCAATFILLNTQPPPADNRSDTNYGTATTVQTENQSSGGGVTEGKKSALVRFDDIIGSGAGQVPASAQWVYRAYVTLRTGNATWDNSPDINAIYPILKDWAELQATYNSRLTATPWGTPGLGAGDDHGATASDAFAPSVINTNYNFDVTPAARDIVQGLTPNYGWIVRDTTGADGASYHSDNSSTQAYRPKLTVETMPNPVGGTDRALFQQGTTLNDTTDATYIFKACNGSGTGTNYGTSGSLLVEQQTTPPEDPNQGIKRTLVRFPDAIGSGAGQVPLGATVVSAKLALASTTDPCGGPMYVQRMLSDWGEGQATYNDSLTGTPWGAAGMQDGVDYEHIAWPRKHTSGTNCFNEFDVTAIAQAWADGATNHGVVILSATDDGATFLSDDTARPGDRPILVVDTATPGWGTPVRSATAGTTDATYINGYGTSNNTNYGSSTTLLTDDAPTWLITRGLIRFSDLIGGGFNDVPAGACVRSATLRLHISNLQNADANTTNSIYQVLTDWDEDTVTWANFNNGGVAGTNYVATALDSLVPNTTDSFYYFDVAEAVQNWADGQDNYGWLLVNLGGNMAQWDSDDHGIGMYRPLLVVEWVPEPASMLLLGGGLLALLRRRRRT